MSTLSSALTPRSRHAEAVPQDPASPTRAPVARSLSTPSHHNHQRAQSTLEHSQDSTQAAHAASSRNGPTAPPPFLPRGGWHPKQAAAPEQGARTPRRRSVVFAEPQDPLLPVDPSLHPGPQPQSVPTLDLKKLHTPTPPPPLPDMASSGRRPPQRRHSSYVPGTSPRPPSFSLYSADEDQAFDMAGLLQEAMHFSTEPKPVRPESPSMDASTQREREAEKDRQRFRSEIAQMREPSSATNRLPAFNPSVGSPSGSLPDQPQEGAAACPIPSPRPALNRPLSIPDLSAARFGGGSQRRLGRSKSTLIPVPHLDLRSISSHASARVNPEDPPLTSQRLLTSKASQPLTPSKSSALSDASQQEADAALEPTSAPKSLSAKSSGGAKSDNFPAPAPADSHSYQATQHDTSTFHSVISVPPTKPWPQSARGSAPLHLDNQNAAAAGAAAPGLAQHDQQEARLWTQDSRRPGRAARERMERESPAPPSPSFASLEQAASMIAGARRRRSWLDEISSSPRGAQSPRATLQAGTAQPATNAQAPPSSTSPSMAPDFQGRLDREVSEAQTEKFAAFKKMREENEQLAKYNPSAFSEDIARAEAAKSRELFDEARQRLEALSAICSPEEDGKYTSSIQLLQAMRPFYVAPIAAKRQVERRPKLDVAATSAKQTWKLEDSIFWQRAKENEARSPFDTYEVIDKQFDLDFARMCTKSRLKRMLAREGCILSAASNVDETLQQLHAEMRKHACTIRSVFAYFSCLSGNITTISMLSLRLIEFIRFTQAARIPDSRSLACKPSDVDTIYSATSFADIDEARSSLGGNSLCRFEFLEVLIRLAVAKYIVPRASTNVCEAVSKLFAECIKPNLSQIAQPDPNHFRRDRLYCKDMELLVLQHWELLLALYRVYKAADRSKMLLIEHWMEMLEAAQLLGPTRYTGVDKTCAKAIFCLSQATVTDELGRRQRAVSLAFFDFVEALARLSEVLAPPPPDELAAWFELHKQQAARAAAESGSGTDDPRLPSGRSHAGRAGSESGLPALLNTGSGSTSRSSSPRRPPARSKSSSLLTRSVSGRFSSVLGAAAGSSGTPSMECTPIDAWFQELPLNSELAQKREEQGGLFGALHQRAQQLPLSASFGPVMELLASRMQTIWGGRNTAETVMRMNQQSESTIGLRVRW